MDTPSPSSITVIADGPAVRLILPPREQASRRWVPWLIMLACLVAWLACVITFGFLEAVTWACSLIALMLGGGAAWAALHKTLPRHEEVRITPGALIVEHTTGNQCDTDDLPLADIRHLIIDSPDHHPTLDDPLLPAD